MTTGEIMIALGGVLVGFGLGDAYHYYLKGKR